MWSFQVLICFFILNCRHVSSFGTLHHPHPMFHKKSHQNWTNWNPWYITTYFKIYIDTFLHVAPVLFNLRQFSCSASFLRVAPVVHVALNYSWKKTWQPFRLDSTLNFTRKLYNFTVSAWYLHRENTRRGESPLLVLSLCKHQGVSPQVILLDTYTEIIQREVILLDAYTEKIQEEVNPLSLYYLYVSIKEYHLRWYSLILTQR